MSQVLFRSGGLSVDNTMLRTLRFSYPIDKIEKITLTRPLIGYALAISVASGLLLQSFGPYLYEVEKMVCLGVMIFPPLVSWFIGALSVTSKSYSNDQAVIGFMPTLKKARVAIEDVLLGRVEVGRD